MAPIKAIWTRIIYVFDFLTGTSITPPPLTDKVTLQIPVQSTTPQAIDYPIFDPPDDLEPSPFRCEYPDYPEKDGWIACNTNTDRQCWLNNTKTGQQYNITTDYENDGPRGIVREYYLELAESTLNADGSGNVYVQLFNGTYPGPRLQACWGDQLQITINNTLKGNGTDENPGNGTTIHWHGIRQWKTGFMDGVNGVTQCPIAPGQSFTYIFNVTQYGTSWYHSHYSLQYAAGLLGPLTIYGPMSQNFDHQLQPIIMSDWMHDSVYTKWDRSLIKPGRIAIDNILQNGIGHWPPLDESKPVPPKGTRFNEILFQKGVKYLIRLVNSAADTTFIFSIDNHSFDVTSTDFVAIKPYHTNHVVVGIGQRYNIIVEAKPDTFSNDVNFWIRTTPAPNCTSFGAPPIVPPDALTGIVRYTLNDAYPTTSRQNFTPTCADETYYRDLIPMVNWTVSSSRHELSPFYLNFNTATGYPYYDCEKTTSHFQLVPNYPMWLNWSDPPLLQPDEDFSKKPWLTVVNTGNVPDEDWIQITVISGGPKSGKPTLPRPIPKVPGIYVPSQHPIHFHGHDFAVLDQCVPDSKTACDINNANITLINPPRRDVAFLPDGGYLILAFKADNPGAWIMHCHIAFHASMGLAAQILENVDSWPETFGFGWDEPFEFMCKQWNEWNPFDPSDPCMHKNPSEWPLQTDSGI